MRNHLDFHETGELPGVMGRVLIGASDNYQMIFQTRCSETRIRNDSQKKNQIWMIHILLFPESCLVFPDFLFRNTGFCSHSVCIRGKKSGSIDDPGRISLPSLLHQVL